MKCKACGKKIVDKDNLQCDWRQGRCPYRHPIFNMIVLDNYKMRVYNLFEIIKGWFK
jgi:hypothetical protein